jgi:hypothetical protein
MDRTAALSSWLQRRRGRFYRFKLRSLCQSAPIPGRANNPLPSCVLTEYDIRLMPKPAACV